MPRQPEPPFPKLHPIFTGPIAPWCRTGALPSQRVTPPCVSVSLPKEKFYPPPLKSCITTTPTAFPAEWDPRLLLPWILLEKKTLFSEIYNPLEAPDPAASKDGTSVSIPQSHWDQRTNPSSAATSQGPPKNQGQCDSPPDLLHSMRWGWMPSRSPFFLSPHGGFVMGVSWGCPVKPP